MKNIADFEIMAPVGSYDSLAAAIQGGAGQAGCRSGQVALSGTRDEELFDREYHYL